MSRAKALTEANRAKKICQRCPYIEECFAYALATNQEGIWGGTTTNERNKIRRAKLRQKYPQPRQAAG